jgi:hypothetical protein
MSDPNPNPLELQQTQHPEQVKQPQKKSGGGGSFIVFLIIILVAIVGYNYMKYLSKQNEIVRDSTGAILGRTDATYGMGFWTYFFLQMISSGPRASMRR